MVIVLAAPSNEDDTEAGSLSITTLSLMSNLSSDGMLLVVLVKSKDDSVVKKIVNWHWI